MAVIQQRWYPLEDAPPEVQGYLYAPAMGRTDIVGQVVQQVKGPVGTSAHARGYTFTHWHPLLEPPINGKGKRR